jgi:signal transduction histidine kinase
MTGRVAERWAVIRRMPYLLDGLLALTLAMLGIVPLAAQDALSLPAAALIAVQTLSLTARCRWPLQVYAVVGVTTVVYANLGFPATFATFAVLVAVYTVAAHLALRVAIVGAAIYVVGMTFSLIGFYRTADPSPELFLQEWLLNILALSIAWVLGVTMRTRRAYVRELEARARLLEREQDERARLAVALERGRIARELHDVVAHSVSVMVVQAAAAERLVERDPARAAEALDNVRITGRRALEEMRRLVGLLRHEEAPPELGPQRGLDALEELAAEVTRAGVPVELSVQGSPRPLPQIVEVSAYRVIQESLTNTLKHAGPARARVILRYAPDALEVQVSDTGSVAAREPAQPEAPAEDGGHGLIGMRERIALFNGELNAGPRPEGGYAVVARIPLAGIGG